MARKFTRRGALAVLAVGGCAPWSMIAVRARAHAPAADSSYALAYTHGVDELIGDLVHGERGDPERESDTPHREWYSHHVRRHLALGGRDPGPTRRWTAWN